MGSAPDIHPRARAATLHTGGSKALIDALRTHGVPPFATAACAVALASTPPITLEVLREEKLAAVIAELFSNSETIQRLSRNDACLPGMQLTVHRARWEIGTGYVSSSADAVVLLGPVTMTFPWKKVDIDRTISRRVLDVNEFHVTLQGLI